MRFHLDEIVTFTFGVMSGVGICAVIFVVYMLMMLIFGL